MIMKIRGSEGEYKFPEKGGPESPNLRDPSLEDLPRLIGHEVPHTTFFIRTVLSKEIGENMKNKVKKVEATLFSSDEEFKKVVGELADAFIADLQEKNLSDLEPYEAYVTRVKRDLLDKCGNFRERFFRGYDALQGPLKKDEWAKKDEDKLPPGTIL
jgi:hypothetical protein